MEQKRYKILYVGNFSEKSVGEPEIANSFEELGHEVTRLEEKDVDWFTVKKKIDRGDHDFLLFAKFRVGNPVEIHRMLYSVKAPKICWVFDLYWGL